VSNIPNKRTANPPNCAGCIIRSIIRLFR
jgi:hypothetical protein